MFTALVSLLTGRTVKSDTAMTGEISLRGLVLPVGGIKEKVVAAARAELCMVILPARNRKDYEDIPEAARNELRFVWAERVEDVIDAALEPAIETASLELGGQVTPVLSSFPQFAHATFAGCRDSRSRRFR